MKNQYFGDSNDFRKYGLLRMVQRGSNLSIGVCWFLTSDDGGADGELRKYLSEPQRWRNYDSELFDKLQRLMEDGVRRSVSHAQAWGLVAGAVYFEQILRDSRSARSAYFEAGTTGTKELRSDFCGPR